MTFPSTSERQIYKKLKEFENKSILMTDEDIFKEINKLDSSYKDNKSYQLNIDGILVNIGSKKRSIKLLSFAKKRLEKMLKDKKNDWILYFFGNAEFEIASIKLSTPIADLISNKNFRKARDTYNSISSEKVLPQAYTNHANILEKYSRNYEAIFLYDKALRFNPKFGMALGNKAIALLYYYDLAKKKNPDIIFQAKDLLKNAIELKNTVEVGGEVAVKTFNKKYKEVCHIIRKSRLRRPTKEVLKNSKSDYVKFCMDKNIFLNYCFNCYQCDDGIRDNFSPIFLDRINFGADNKNYRFSSYSKKTYYSIKNLNQIYEDYATARLIYFKALTENYDKQDKITSYSSALDYCQNSLKYGFMKITFIRLFNILDKIAHLLFTYFEIEKDSTNIYFKDLKTRKFENLVISKNSWNLLALHSLAWDFETNQIYSYLSKTRNNLTHDFIDIKIDMYDLNGKDKLYKKHHLTEQILCEYIDSLFLIVKAALMYFVNALYQEYKKNEGKIGYIPNINIVSQDYIFSDEED